MKCPFCGKRNGKHWGDCPTIPPRVKISKLK